MFIIEIILPDYSSFPNGDIDESAVIDIICDKMFGFYYAKIAENFRRDSQNSKEKSAWRNLIFTL
jgi:hypothetical protein